MKKILLSLMLLSPLSLFSDLDRFEELLPPENEMSQFVDFIVSQKIRYDILLSRECNVQFYIVYKAKSEAYGEMLAYIMEY